jgi:hypothetical protein
MATARDVVEASLREIGVLAASETATAEDATNSLARLNLFLDTLGTERQAIYTITRSTWNITSGVGTYAVATGQVVNIARPVFVDRVGYQDVGVSPPTPEYPLGKLTEQGWQSITEKELTSTLPQAWYYNPTYPNGTLSLWPVPVPSSTLQGVIYAWTAVSQLAALDTAISMPNGYQEMLMTNLALLLCPTFERQPHPVLAKRAADTLANVKRINQRPADLSFDPAALGQNNRRRYNIQEG